ncbi:histamine H2 receptor-like [Exaiptasia diaphana]|uniref:G-protein coupled receptors family 1 profile domain-containing protein n=1 Tax=Exaiptasia diaphana TaxID=2652724 RepID=A0A913YEY5_EXADI|nr:histamine H2 receptor-like [Exaiptasia diaphana]XP_028513895.1 histamine H2 receptor-like [Exaiptasia diaphana]
MNTSIAFTNFNFTSKAHSTQEPLKLFELPMVLVIITTFIMIIVLILTVVGNLAVMIVFASSDLLRSTVNNHFLFSLAMADLLVGLLVMPCAIDALRTQRWRCGVFLKYFTGFGNFCFCISSIMHLMMLSVDKYLSIIKPLKYPSIMTQRRVYLSCILLWLYSAFWALLPLMGVSSYECFIPYIGFCASEDWSMYGLNFAFAISVVSGTYGVALVVMFVVYWRIAKVIKDQTFKINPTAPKMAEHEEKKQKKSMKQKLLTKHKGVLTLITLIVTYLICWSPFCILLFVEIGKGEKVDTAISLIGMLTGFVNSCCNPIIYWAKYSSFRRAVLRMCKKGFPFLPSSFGSNAIHDMSQTGPGYDTAEPSLYVDRIMKYEARKSLKPCAVYNDVPVEMKDSTNE